MTTVDGDNNSAWKQEGMIPGQPAHDPEWERQRHKLFGIIHKLIDVGCSLAEVKEAALAVNKNLPKPFTDGDVLRMCGWGWRKWGHEEPTNNI